MPKVVRIFTSGSWHQATPNATSLLNDRSTRPCHRQVRKYETRPAVKALLSQAATTSDLRRLQQPNRLPLPRIQQASHLPLHYSLSSFPSSALHWTARSLQRPSHELPTSSKLCRMWAGMGHHICSPSVVRTAHFHGIANTAQAVIDTHTAFQLPFGKTFRFFSLKWTFLAALLIFEVGSVLCAAAQSSAMLIVGVSGQAILTTLRKSLFTHNVKRSEQLLALGALVSPAVVSSSSQTSLQWRNEPRTRACTVAYLASPLLLARWSEALLRTRSRGVGAFISTSLLAQSRPPSSSCASICRRSPTLSKTRAFLACCGISTQLGLSCLSPA